MGGAQAHLRGILTRWRAAASLDEPNSRLAVWARRLAFFSLIAALFSIIIIRSGLLEFEPGVATFLGALALAGVSILLALGAFVVIWKDGLGGLGIAFTGARDRRPAAALPGLSRLQGLQAARDFRHHHGPDRSAAFRSDRAAANPRSPIRSSMPASMPPSSSATPIRTSSRCSFRCRPRAAYDAALALVDKRSWLVIDARAPQAGPPRGPHRGGGAHPDHGLSRRRRDPRPPRCRRLAHGHALGVALRAARSRHQCIARSRASSKPSKRMSTPNRKSWKRPNAGASSRPRSKIRKPRVSRPPSGNDP